jgi:hypothetical protein
MNSKSLDSAQDKATSISPSRQVNLNRFPGLELKLDTSKGTCKLRPQHQARARSLCASRCYLAQ